MDHTAADVVEERGDWVEGWNRTMVQIWQEQIYKFHIIDTSRLYRSVILTRYHADGRITSLDISFAFLEYGVWQHFGVGREYKIGNPGDVKCLGEQYREEHNLDEPRKRGPKWGGGYTSGHPRAKREWFMKKYYSSVMNLKEFMASSAGKEFIGLFANLDASDYRKSSLYRKTKGLS